MRERLATEADAEQGRAFGDPAPQGVVLLVQPGVLELVTDVLIAAEDDHGVELGRRRHAARADVPFDELVSVLDDHVGEHLRPDVRAVRDGEHAHQAVGTCSSSSSLRRSCAPAGA